MNMSLIAGLTLSLGAGVLVGASTFNGPRELRATRFVVTDANGREVMVLSANPAGEGVIEFLGADGKPVMKVDASEGSLLRNMSDSAKPSEDVDKFIEDFKKKHAKDGKTVTDSQTSRDSKSARDSKSDSQSDSDSDSQSDSQTDSQRDSKSDKQSSRDSDSSSSSQSKRDAGRDSNSNSSSDTSNKSSGSNSTKTNTSGSSSSSSNTSGSTSGG